MSSREGGSLSPQAKRQSSRGPRLRGGSVGEAIRAAAVRLEATSDTARLDAELLMAHALGLARSDMLLRAMGDVAPDGFDALVERRAEREPVAYITGLQEFYGLDFSVAPGVLIPRSDSEVLIDAAKEAFAERDPPQSILDLGTGSGALLLAALSIFPEAFGHAVDCSDAVIPTLFVNVERHGEGRGIAFELTDWRRPDWRKESEPVDLILCNPPYVEDDANLDRDVRDYEPAAALFAGPDGLDDYRILIPQLRGLMAENAVAIFEIGHRQAESVTEIARAHGFAVELRRDLANRPRALILT